MAQDLTVNIKTTSDVPQAMNKASSAVVGFNKQIEDIQKKFSTSFKDIFLGFAAPMVLLQGIMGFLAKSAEDAKRMAKEGLDILAAGESKLVTTEEKRAAAYFKRKKEMEDEKNLVEAGRTNVAKQILENKDGEFKDFNLPEEYVRKLREGSETIDSLSKNKDVQRLAMDYFNKTDKGKEIEASLAAEAKSDQKAGSFKGPEGFGTVVGVGANPVMEKMTRQNELLDQIRLILEQQYIDNRNGTVPDPFTERVNAPTLKAGLA
jgi:predicted DNA-binding protein